LDSSAEAHEVSKVPQSTREEKRADDGKVLNNSFLRIAEDGIKNIMSKSFLHSAPLFRNLPLPPFALPAGGDMVESPAKGSGGEGSVILFLPGWQYVRTIKDSPRDLHIEVQPISPPPCCQHCGRLPLFLTPNGKSRLRFVKDTPTGSKHVRLYFKRQRYMCSACNKTTPQPLAGIGNHKGLTDRLVAFIKREVFNSTFTRVADVVGVSEKKVRDIFTNHGEELIRSTPPEASKLMGIDGVYISGKRCCVITDLISGRVVELLEESNSTAVSKCLVQMKNREKVQIVTIDMSWPFAKAVRKRLPQAVIVVDLFHIQKEANKDLHTALRNLRKLQKFWKLKDEWRQKQKYEKPETTQDRKVKRTRFLLFKRHSDLSKKELAVLGKWILEIPELGLWYELKEKFLNIFQSHDRKEAEERYDCWEQRVEQELPEAYRNLRKSMRNWRRAIFNYFDHGRVTNALTEAINLRIKTLQRVGRGYTFEVLKVKLLYAELKPRWPRQNKKKKRDEPRPHNPNSNVERLKRAFKEQDKVGDPTNPSKAEGWNDRFTAVKAWMKAKHDETLQTGRNDVQSTQAVYVQGSLF
jgi:transposase